MGLRKLVLHNEHQDLRTQTQAKAQDEQVKQRQEHGLAHIHERHQIETDGAHCAHGQGHPFVLARLADNPARGRGRNENAHGKRRNHESRQFGRHAIDNLEVRGQVVHCAHKGHVDQQRHDGAEVEVAIMEQSHGNDGLRNVALHQHEHHTGYREQRQKADDLPTEPRIDLTAPSHSQHQCRHSHGHNGTALPVEGQVLPMQGRLLQEHGQSQDGQPGQGHREPENPAPAQGFHEPAAQQRAEHIRYREHRPHNAQVQTALARRYYIGNGRLRQDDQATTAQTRDEAPRQKHSHVHGKPAHNLAQGVQHQSADQQKLAADDIAHFAVDGHSNSRGQNVGRCDPLHDFHAAQVSHNGGQRSGRNGLGQRTDEHSQQQAGEDECQLPTMNGSAVGR